MIYDRQKFFTAIRTTLPPSKSLSQGQVDGFNLLLTEGETRAISAEWIAYVLATAWHETGAMMVPVRETFATSDAQAIANLNRAYPNVASKYWVSGYFGRGYVQLTWSYNYKLMGQWLNVDLLGNPSLALDPTIATKIIYEGMIRGMFTAKKLSDYIANVLESDAQEYQEYIRARAIVNGQDRAALIAGYALTIEKALVNSVMLKLVKLNDSDPEPDPISLPPAPQNQPISLVNNMTVWAALGSFMTTVITALSGLTPIVQIVLLLFGFGFLFWTIYQTIKGNNSIDRVF